MSGYRMVVIGDSFAEGRGDPDPAGGFVGWVPRVAHRLAIPAADVLNLGAYGATTQDVVDQQLDKIADVDTPLLGIAVGGNDLVRAYDPDGFRRNLRTVFDAVAAAGRRVFTHDYPDIPGKLPGLAEEQRSALQVRFAEANAFLAGLCAERGVLRYELSTAALCADPDMWYPDGIHPSALGHRTIADEIAALLA
ncbi:SGNH/GDSL hydrolase family protein [Pseudonocardia parietis]|uniref:Lysophospholipase L1-like esterase n=1 Tax=Pseudonocardia parietis TaxID=570936 RepID=A0ABS4W6K6_9PSEU|nr:SGNH/GDSL hydrolase family protein [Pseudonocardia parietis]MBP2371833.1 lysophospholipase L1-like esterase [Pseudonocardia parietis]